MLGRRSMKEVILARSSWIHARWQVVILRLIDSPWANDLWRYTYASLWRDGNATVSGTAVHQLVTVSDYAKIRPDVEPKTTPELPLPAERSRARGLSHP